MTTTSKVQLKQSVQCHGYITCTDYINGGAQIALLTCANVLQMMKQLNGVYW